MFEKYKELKKKRTHLGMSGKEYFKFVIMVLVALACLVVLMYAWPRAEPEEGTPVEIPRDIGRIEMPTGETKAGEAGTQDRFEKLRDQLLNRRREAGDESGELALPEIPKPPAPWEPDSEIWKQVDDASTDQLEEQVVLYALHQLNSMTQEEILKKVEEDGNIPPSDFMQHPGEYRGKFVSITGTLMYMENQILPPNRSGLNLYWYGLLYNQRHKPYRKFYFYIFDKDREWLTQQEARSRDLSRNGDLVTVNGIFVKLYRNCTEGGAIMTYPFIVARKLEPAQDITLRGQWQYSWVMLTVITVVLGGVFIFLFIAMRRDRKEGDAFLHSRKYRKAGLVTNEQARKAAAKAKGKDAVSAGSEASQDGPLSSQMQEPGDASTQPDAPESADSPDNTS